jgi:hypothetical protein
MTQARSEFEFEDEYELEDEFEDEAFLGGLASIAGSLLGEGDGEWEDEVEGEWEAEDEAEDEFEVEGEAEWEDEVEDEWEAEDEFEIEGEDEWEVEGEDEAEYFFKSIGRFVRRNSGLLKKIAKVAAPLVATAVGGPAAGMLAKAVTSQLEGEMEEELEAEMEAELEEMASGPVSAGTALGEYLAARAATAQSESEAEAFIGSAVTVTLTQHQMRELEELMPQLLRGASLLTRILRRNPGTRQAVRFVPGIVNTASRQLSHQIATGQRVGSTDVGTALGRSTRRVLTDPQWTDAVSRRHARGLARVHRTRRTVRHGGYAPARRYAGTYGGTGSLRTRRVTPVVRRQPQHTRVVSPRGPVGRPRPGFVRVVTPVRVPPRAGRPARVMKVVTDIKVPRGTVPTGRPAARTTARRR